MVLLEALEHDLACFGVFLQRRVEDFSSISSWTASSAVSVPSSSVRPSRRARLCPHPAQKVFEPPMSVSSSVMASMSGFAPGIRLATAATALAIAPFTAVAADDSLTAPSASAPAGSTGRPRSGRRSFPRYPCIGFGGGSALRDFFAASSSGRSLLRTIALCGGPLLRPIVSRACSFRRFAVRFFATPPLAGLKAALRQAAGLRYGPQACRTGAAS